MPVEYIMLFHTQFLTFDMTINIPLQTRGVITGYYSSSNCLWWCTGKLVQESGKVSTCQGLSPGLLVFHTRILLSIYSKKCTESIMLPAVWWFSPIYTLLLRWHLLLVTFHPSLHTQNHSYLWKYIGTHDNLNIFYNVPVKEVEMGSFSFHYFGITHEGSCCTHRFK